MVGGERGAEAFFALGVDAGGNGLEVFDCFEEGEGLGHGERVSGGFWWGISGIECREGVGRSTIDEDYGFTEKCEESVYLHYCASRLVKQPAVDVVCGTVDDGY